MPSVSVKVNPTILNWLMQKAQQGNVGSSVIDLIKKWISGEKEPTFSQIETVSKNINIPFGYFFLDKPPVEECKIVDFRTVDSISIHNPSRDLIDTVDLMSSVQEWMSEYNRDNGASEYVFVGSVKTTDDVIHTAKTIRKELNLNLNWFEDFRNAREAFNSLRNTIADIGVIVMMNGIVGNNTHRPLNVSEFRAFALTDPYAPLIFINSRDADNGKLFSLLHELVHVWIGKDNFYNDVYGLSQKVSKEEQFCNAVAAEILVPDSIFIDEWSRQTGSNETIIYELEKKFICSSFTLLIKAFNTRRIEKAEFNRLLNLFKGQFEAMLNQKQEKISGGGDFYRTLATKWDRKVIQAMYSGVQSGRNQYRDVYRLTNTNGKTFHELVRKAGIV
jgi:hypothetical protein|nr:MAG TPA: putative Zn peptidase [Caudoviricetes sp.]DAX63267.1 MAG TPA: putative Zn peptidase [Caudoviricetes sp.]